MLCAVSCRVVCVVLWCVVHVCCVCVVLCVLWCVVRVCSVVVCCACVLWCFLICVYTYSSLISLRTKMCSSGETFVVAMETGANQPRGRRRLDDLRLHVALCVWVGV